jgi:Recombination protein O N terminal
MTYHAYTTKAIILHVVHTGENDSVYIMSTESLGLIVTRGTGVRFLKSKLRHVLVLGSCVLVTLIQGKQSWKIIGAEEMYVPELSMRKMLARLHVFIRKTIVFDVREGALYNILATLMRTTLPIQIPATRHTLEYIALIRILHYLSLWPHSFEHELLLRGEYTEQVLLTLAPQMPTYRRTAQEVLRTAFL